MKKFCTTYVELASMSMIIMGVYDRKMEKM